ncbi:MAG: SMI1/KNR4 family protein [Paracoccaceae bacterium]
MYDVEFWTDARRRVLSISRIDAKNELLFFSASHKYAIFPPVSEKRLSTFELRNDVEIPQDYRSFLATFGAGGVGPGHGIYDFTELESESVKDSFHLTASREWSDDDDDDDDDPIWGFPGLLTICTSGCAIDWLIEINGPQPGTMWVVNDAELRRCQNFGAWYAEWLDRIELGLQKYNAILDMIAFGAQIPQILSDCRFEVVEYKCGNETYTGFKGVPGRFRKNGADLVLADVGSAWIE